MNNQFDQWILSTLLFTGSLISAHNECDYEPCGNGAECIPVDDYFECVCPEGFYGRRCTECGYTRCLSIILSVIDELMFCCCCVDKPPLMYKLVFRLPNEEFDSDYYDSSTAMHQRLSDNLWEHVRIPNRSHTRINYIYILSFFLHFSAILPVFS